MSDSQVVDKEIRVNDNRITIGYKMNTFRYKPPSDWLEGKSNQMFLGFCTMLSYIDNFFNSRNDLKMIEIGSYMGESTSLFSSTGIFSEIHCIEPFDHDQDCLDVT